jgi:hypothetical protein
VYREKWKFVRKKWKMTLKINVQFNGSVINLLVSRDEASRGSTERRTMSRSGFDLEKHRPMGQAYNPRPENHGYHCMESIGISLDRSTS